MEFRDVTILSLKKLPQVRKLSALCCFVESVGLQFLMSSISSHSPLGRLYMFTNIRHMNKYISQECVKVIEIIFFKVIIFFVVVPRRVLKRVLLKL